MRRNCRALPRLCRSRAVSRSPTSIAMTLSSVRTCDWKQVALDNTTRPPAFSRTCYVNLPWEMARCASVELLPRSRSRAGYDLTIEARKIPLTSVVRLARQAKKQIPADLVASGLLNGEFHGANGLANGLLVSEKERTNLHDQLRQYQLRQWTGIGSATNVLLSSNSGKDDLAITAIPLSLAGTVNGSRVASALSRPGPLAEQEPAGPHLRIGPGAVAVNGSVPVSAGGWISTAGYRFFLRGDVR